jgi:hypothetical protein
MTTSLFTLRGSGLGFIFTICLMILYAILHFWLKYQKNKLVSESKTQRENLKKIGEKVIVMYDELEIKTRSWKQEVVVGSGTNSRNEYVDVNNNHIYLKKLHRGHYFEQELVIDMSPEILRMKLALKTELNLYYNPKDLDDYFLDLEFLFE